MLRLLNLMIEYQSVTLDTTYSALADPSRRAMLTRLRDGDLRVTEIARPFDMSLNAVSKHLKVLERAGLVRRTVKGRDHWLSLAAEPLMDASDWIGSYRAFWERRLDALESFLSHEKGDRAEERS